MGSSPDLTNSRGDTLSASDLDTLYGELKTGAGGPGDIGDRKGAKDPLKSAEMLQNWLFGIRPKAVDPTDALGRAKDMFGVTQKGGAGAGMSGLFGASKFVGELPPLPSLNMGPMASGVPYAVPPLPKLFDPGSGPGGVK